MINILEKLKQPYPIYTTSSGEALILDEKTTYYSSGNDSCRYVLGSENNKMFYKCTGLKHHGVWDTNFSTRHFVDNLDTFTKEDIHSLNG